ncbi:MAG: cache domain-containing protein [Rubrivivax sp.]
MLRRFARLSIRHKLLVMVLMPLLVVLPLLGLILLWWANVAFDGMLIAKVRTDLAVAEGYFDRVLGEVGSSTGAIADSHLLHEALNAEAAPKQLVALLQRYRERERLDFVNLRGPDGGVRATDRAAPGSALPAGTASSGEPTPAAPALPHLTDRTTVEVLGQEQLRVMAPAFAARAVVPLLDTRNAEPSTRQSEDRAMVLLATRPVLAADGRLLGHVQAGLLLNRNLALIDHVNEIVYPPGALPFGSQGTATLFLDDVRISTNVRLFGGPGAERAIGTRVSSAVRDAVLQRGSTWLDRAFVVDQWYVSAYKPLADGAGRRVGMLDVGYLEAPFRLLKYGILAAIGLVFFAVMIAASFVSMRLAREIFSPIERMGAVMRRVEQGALDARVGPVDTGDEIGHLATHLDQVLATLQGWHAELDAMVAERTRQLADAQAQLVRSEKMATIGQLTACVAHEMNNPIAVIQGNLDLLRTQLPPEVGAAVRTEARLIDQQIDRLRVIVAQLLQFARPSEFAGYVQSVEPVAVLEDCLVLVEHELSRARIDVERRFDAVPKVAINRQELQQVLVNLLVNAIHAMPGGGTLTIGSGLCGGQVEMSVMDTGDGLAPEVQAQLFQPFVTHKKDGTGLGLWISRGIVERYGGDMRGCNRDDGVRGARFSVLLPSDAAARPAAQGAVAA